MAVTTPPSVDALPTAPSTSAPSTFATLADAFIAALATLRTQFNALASNVFGNATDAATSATSAATQVALATAQASASAASATASAAASGATKWVSGTTYSEGAGVWSPANFQSYRRKTAGAGITDPSFDPTNWAQIGGSVPSAAFEMNYQLFGGL